MKMRIQDNSLRLRLTLKEVEAFAVEGTLQRTMQIVNTGGLGPAFQYALAHDPALRDSVVEVGAAGITVRLNAADRAALLQPAEEGVYIQREFAAGGTTHRFMVLVEKDRPGSTCVKKEQWIYDAPPHGPVETRPIPIRSGGGGATS